MGLYISTVVILLYKRKTRN